MSQNTASEDPAFLILTTSRPLFRRVADELAGVKQKNVGSRKGVTH